MDDNIPPELKMKKITLSQNNEKDFSDSEPGTRSSTKENFPFSVIDISLKEQQKDTFFNTGLLSQTENQGNNSNECIRSIDVEMEEDKITNEKKAYEKELEKEFSDSEPGTRSSTKKNLPFSVIDILLKEQQKDTFFNTGLLSQTETQGTAVVKDVENDQSMDIFDIICEAATESNNSNECIRSIDVEMEADKITNEKKASEKELFDCFASTNICLDILTSIIDSITCLDFSSGSSDEYIPDSYESDESTIKRRSKTKNKKKSIRKVPELLIHDTDFEEIDLEEQSAKNKQPRRKNKKKSIVIPVSDSEEIDLEGQKNSHSKKFWNREGMKNLRKNKPRKSEKERRQEREAKKIARNTGKAYVTKSGKQVPERSQEVLEPCKRFKCSDKVPESFRKSVFEYYWSLGTYEKRRRFISSCIDLNKKKSARLEITGNRHREFSNKYILRYLDKQYSVCKACFLKILNETAKFIQIVREHMAKTDSKILDDSSRGLHLNVNAVSEERLEEAKEHILSFPAYESHYGRSKTNKKFLPSNLNITVMYDLYKENSANPISKTLYTAIFKAQNLSFKVPCVDTCFKCDELQAKLKAETTESEQNKIKGDIESHHKAAEDVYDAKTEDKENAKVKKDLMVLTFDLQQCLPTPYLTTGAAFYKRQLWTYNLTIHNCVTNEATCYMWHEAEGARGGNEIASCIYHFIANKVPDSIKHIILYSDSCSGQNKNRIVIVMFLLAIKNTHIETIEHKFFIPGHTHMECDTDHALIEKEKKKTNMHIYLPRDWYQLVRNLSKSKKITVQEMTQQYFLDFSSLLKRQNAFVARTANSDKERFLITEVRVFKYTKELFPKFMYRSDGCTEFKTVDYGRKKKQDTDFTQIPLAYNGPLPISKEKKQDLLSLLPLIDEHSRQFYRDLTSSADVPNIDPDLENWEED